MPSSAFSNFDSNLQDTDRMIDTFRAIKTQGAGKGHLTRGAVVLLCAAWELYVEQLLQKAAEIYSQRHDSPSSLPLPVQETINRSVKNDKHNLKPLQLAGDGWKTVYCSHIEERTENLNTPKSSVIAPLFNDFLGIANITLAWSQGALPLDDFITVRGDIAHRGRQVDT